MCSATPVIGSGDSRWLKGTAYGFAIPAGSTINGILVEIRGWATNDATRYTYFYDLWATKTGTRIGTNKGDASSWGSTPQTRSYGGATDLWGTTWSVAEINAAGFGFHAHWYLVTDTGADTYLGIEFYRVTVYYTPPAGGAVKFCSVLCSKFNGVVVSKIDGVT